MKNWILVLLLAFLLTIILTWPFFINLTSYYTDQGDYPLAGSVLWYNQDSIKTGRIFNQKEYFQGYQFYGQPYSLAFINHSFVPSLIFAPIYWITNSLPFSVNSLAFLTYVLSFISAYYLINYFVKNPWASLVGATIYTFNPLTMVRFPHHLDILNKYFLPLVFLFAYKFLEKPTWKNSFLFGLFFTLNALSVNYYQIFTVVMLPLVAMPFLLKNLIRKNWTYFINLTKFSLVILIFLPVLLYFNLPYLSFADKEGAGRSVEEAGFFSARINDWFGSSPDSLLYGSWTKYLEKFRSPKDDRGILNYEEHTLFLNILPIILFILGFKFFMKEKINHSFFFILLGVTFILTFGPFLGLYSVFYQLLPFMQGIRVPTRFEFLFYIPFALIASYGALWLIKKRGVWTVAVVGVILILENFTVKNYDLRSQILPQAQLLQEELGFLKDKVTLHLPIYTTEDADVFGKGAAYFNWLTKTGERVFNGNSAYLPPDHMMLLYEIKQNPDERAFTKLAILGVNYVVIHKKLLTPQDPVKKIGQVVFEDPDILVIDISKFGLNVPICVPEKDLDFKVSQAQDQDFNLSYALVIQNKDNCFLPSTFENRYQKMEVEVDGIKKWAYYKMPILINPKEQVILSEINRELKIR